mmetsp:Transcript_8989/g.26444  ORF Transcript_8989/g.26444 Transcript_8989/m.26444 type:complete len:287 (+) Transcript_8989:36-896(+)
MARVMEAALAALAVLALLPRAAAQEVISDLTTSSADEQKALQVKAAAFWKPLLRAAEDLCMEEHFAVYADAEQVLATLPPQNTYAREALQEALERLKRADAKVLAQATGSSQLASEKLQTSPGGSQAWDVGLSFLTGGQGFLSQALKRFVDGGQYSERLLKQISDRQAEVLPLLRGAAGITGGVLDDCRLASKRSFDLLKYDIYNKGVPKTPEPAKAIAYRIVDAAGSTRKRFTGFITEAVSGITRDLEGKRESPAATVARDSLAGVEAGLPPATSSTAEPPVFNL